MRYISVCLVLWVMVCMPLSSQEGEAELWPLRIYEMDMLILSDGEPKLGTIEDVRDDGVVLFREANATGAIGYRAHQYREYWFRRGVQDVLEQRLQILLQRQDAIQTPFDILSSLRWAVDNASDDDRAHLREWAIRAVQAHPDHVPLKEYSLRLFTPGEDDQAIETVAAAGIEANPHWESGYHTLLRLYERMQREADLRRMITVTLQHRPNSLVANRLHAERAFAAGDLAEAREAYRRATADDNVDALVGYAITSLLLRQWSTAERSAQNLLAVGEHTASATAVLGTIRLQEGDEEEALALLARSYEQQDQLTAQILPIVRHNLGLVLWRQGDSQRAQELWQASTHEASALALATMTSTPIEPRAVSSSTTLTMLAHEHNAVLALQRGEFHPGITQHLNATENRRHRFLEQVRLIMAENGDRERVQALAFTDSHESRRWQVYGHILAGRHQQAWDIAQRLPDNDGYAAVARTFIRADQGEQEGAAAMYRQLVEPLAVGHQGQPPPPPEYVAVLAAEFDTATGQYRRYNFDWPAGLRLGAGWSQHIPDGSGLGVEATGEALRLHATGTGRGTALVRAWCRAREGSLASVLVEGQLQGPSSVSAGVEVLDGDRRMGVGVARGEDGTLRWRQLRGGRWTAWTMFNPIIRVPADRPLQVQYRSPGRVQVRDAEHQPVMVGEAFAPSGHLTISVFAEGPADQEWEYLVDRMDIGQREQ
ncbi:MAG: hypothetical protein EA401_02710 [Planctomycetota bacterium]|nr:MAG: hypothetical protein EA401_02710 [Planctomycetota bacterium]